MNLLPQQAWQPLTPRGVAAFAWAPGHRLVLAQLAVAVFSAVVGAWFVSANWLPVVREAMVRLPPGAVVRGGSLHWTTNTPVRLAENRFLAVVVDAGDGGSAGRVADLELALHNNHYRLASLLGFVERPYPRGWILSLDASEVVPWWGARESFLLILLAGAIALGLPVLWWVVAASYCPAVWALGRFQNRPLGLISSWKLSGAALMPGAILLTLGLLSYGALGLDLIRLGLVFLLHLVAGWVYVAASVCFLPRLPEAASGQPNPFAEPAKPTASSSSEPANPFARRSD
jgi:hypothetical protein